MPPRPSPPAPAAAPDARPIGRRERNKRDKLRRILAAATELFTAHGYSAVSTQQIADAADVGTGTLFRYAGSKAGLLMLVMNEQLRIGVERGVALARSGAAPADAILALVTPLVEAGSRHPENTAVYQRETLFGTGPERETAAAEVARIESAIEEILRIAAASRPPHDPDRAAHDPDRPARAPHRPAHDPDHPALEPGRSARDLGRTAHAIYSTMYMDIVRVCMGRAPADDLTGRLRESVDHLLGGLGAHNEGCK
ncbi:TetR family transcriptional regulator [Streptomyces sp. e14]|uniref:TetR/AcrR family transcriptional regulator n=1 Tax=unclassified Streptomyces TaxID=2593676 RepID=UPI0001D0658B|nr:TetR/AcrR family transcriptional regulator [Streptomyces sp. e14]EFF88953.1 TetR family transcriptional regulator [Streptomyces sp. e14]